MDNIPHTEVVIDDGHIEKIAEFQAPEDLYKELIKAYKEGLDFSKVSTVNLDEYVGLDGTHDQSYRYFMNKNLFENIDILICKVYTVISTATKVK